MSSLVKHAAILRVWAISLFAALAWIAVPAVADLYPRPELEQDSQRITPIIRSIFRETLADLPSYAQRRAEELQLAVPLDGASPIYFGTRPNAPIAIIPIESVRFLEDIAQLETILKSRNCDLGWMQSYGWHLLGLRQRLAPPLDAFAIDAATREGQDPQIAAKKMTGPVLHFLIAHQIGHLLNDDRRNADGSFSPGQEEAADKFALDQLQQRGIAPRGLDLYFKLEHWRDPSGTRIPKALHPLTTDRIWAVGHRILLDPTLFAPYDRDYYDRLLVEYLALDLTSAARQMERKQLAPLSAETLQRDYPPKGMAKACQPPP